MAKIFAKDKIILYDTEFTCWEGSQERDWSGSGEYREIVQIGAVLVNTGDFSVLEEFDMLVKPAKNPVLSDYFINLTAITQEEVDRRGVDFRTAIEKFSQWSEGRDLYSYGNDARVLEENCGFNDIDLPLEKSKCFDVKEVFKKYGVDASLFMSSTIVEAFGQKPSRRGHNALQDAQTIADGLRLLQNKLKNPEN